MPPCGLFFPQSNSNALDKSVRYVVQLRQQHRMQQLIEQLKHLGLGDYESLIYSTLLSASPASATFIAKKCGLSRSSVYTTLSALIAKGLVGTTYKNNVKQFTAEDASTLERLLTQEEAQLQEKRKIVEVMKKSVSFFRDASLNIPQVLFFEGQEGLKSIYLAMMRQASPKATLYLLRDEFVWQPEWAFILGN